MVAGTLLADQGQQPCGIAVPVTTAVPGPTPAWRRP